MTIDGGRTVRKLELLRRQDYFRQASRGWLRLHEKGGKRHDVPAHHRAAEALAEHLAGVGIEEPQTGAVSERGPAERAVGRGCTSGK